tara:strand:- start:1840 stop:2046 length:207 start_codon:yes stop_codon:yes gene_type:complete
MKSRLKRKYEIFDVQTGKWTEKTMTDEEFEHFKRKMDVSKEEMDAEYEIISNIVAQKLGYNTNDESRD